MVEHKRKYERRRETKEADAKRERIRKAQEAYAKAQKEEAERRAHEQEARFSEGQQFPGFPGRFTEQGSSGFPEFILCRWHGRHGRYGWYGRHGWYGWS